MGCALCSLCNKCGKYTEVLKGMGTRACPVCGGQAYEAAQACPHCGAALSISDEVAEILVEHEDISVARWTRVTPRIPIQGLPGSKPLR